MVTNRGSGPFAASARFRGGRFVSRLHGIARETPLEHFGNQFARGKRTLRLAVISYRSANPANVPEMQRLQLGTLPFSFIHLRISGLLQGSS